MALHRFSAGVLAVVLVACDPAPEPPPAPPNPAPGPATCPAEVPSTIVGCESDGVCAPDGFCRYNSAKDVFECRPLHCTSPQHCPLETACDQGKCVRLLPDGGLPDLRPPRPDGGCRDDDDCPAAGEFCGSQPDAGTAVCRPFVCSAQSRCPARSACLLTAARCVKLLPDGGFPD